jgi:hypothetical protein
MMDRGVVAKAVFAALVEHAAPSPLSPSNSHGSRWSLMTKTTVALVITIIVLAIEVAAGIPLGG